MAAICKTAALPSPLCCNNDPPPSFHILFPPLIPKDPQQAYPFLPWPLSSLVPAGPIHFPYLVMQNRP